NALSFTVNGVFTYPVNLSDASVYPIPNAGYDTHNPALTYKSACYSGKSQKNTVLVSQTWHTGQDYRGTTQTPVFAVAVGTVTYSSKKIGVSKNGKPIYGGT